MTIHDQTNDAGRLRAPLLFVSHGAPDLAVKETPTHRFLKALGHQLTASEVQPRAILVVSAHWETDAPRVATGISPETIYDFGNFDPRLRQIVYGASRAGDVAERAFSLLEAAGLGPERDENIGFDHGVWVPLHLLRPAADVPVAQVSIQPARDPAHHGAMGRALAPLLADGVMVLASGALTHNLRAFGGQPVDAPVPDWVSTFNDWLAVRLADGNVVDLLDYRARAPHAVDNHPEDEHLLPLFVAVGAAEAAGIRLAPLHRAYEHGVLAMDVWGALPTPVGAR